METNSSAIADLTDDVASIIPTRFLVIDGNQQIVGPASNVRATSATALLTFDGPLGQMTLPVRVTVEKHELITKPFRTADLGQRIKVLLQHGGVSQFE